MPKLAYAKSTLLLSLLLFGFTAFSQKKITGKITDAQAKPQTGITVTGKGTKISVITTDDGLFTISLPEKTNTLVITSVGFESKEVSISGISNIDVILTTQTSSLNKVKRKV